MSRSAIVNCFFTKTKIFEVGGTHPIQGLTVIPLRIYFRDGIAKCEIALAQGKKVWDRRQDERTRKPAGKRKQRCIAIGGDKQVMQITFDTSRSPRSKPTRSLPIFLRSLIPFRAGFPKSIRPRGGC